MTNSIIIPRQLEEHPEFKKQSKAMQDNFAFYCHIVNLRCFELHKFRNTSNNQIEQSVRRKRIKFVRSKLCEWKIICCDGCFSYRIKGEEKPLGHRFHSDISEDDFQRYTVQTAWGYAGLQKEKESRKQQPPSVRGLETLTGTYRQLAEKLPALGIDVSKARGVIANLPLSRIPSAEWNLEEFEFKQHRACVDDYGRLHTPLTNMMKDLRSLLYLESDAGPIDLFEIDVKNCQPTLLNHLMKEIVENEKIKSHADLTFQGIYEQIASALGSSRSDVKKAFVRFLMGPFFEEAPKCTDLSATELEILIGINNWYAEKFPDVHDYLRKEKTNVNYYRIVNTKERRRRGLVCRPYVYLSHRLQALEAKLVIDKCCGQLLIEQPKMPLFTIHDSILTTEEFADRVEKEIHRSFGSIGLKIKTKNQKRKREGKRKERE